MTERLPVRKTYKLYIGGAFPRSESGRSYPVHDAEGAVLAQAVRGSRKDLREAVRAARSAWPGWSGKTAYNRGQVLYRVAELMEGRRAQFVDEVGRTGAADAELEVAVAIDRWVWYAGWADKVHHILGSVNPVAAPYFNFTIPEPTGVVGVVAPEEPALVGLVSRLAPAIVSGNTAVVLASERWPLPAITLAEVLATSDVPGGVINVLTGLKTELVPWLAGHMDVNAVDLTGVPEELRGDAERAASENVKRLVRAGDGQTEWLSDSAQSPYAITALMEMKTVWHPMGA
ncbi:MAG TPA: aldehyde dehydrogenase family protein [Actinomycetota bacterium]|nr:aldehyde dehydrogenase family protein [Actinomycetota bacterium]